MTRIQRFRYEMFVRVRDYGTAHKDLFPESSTGGEWFKQVTTAVAAIDDHLTKRAIARAEARRVKAATRNAVFLRMKAIAHVARRVTRGESGENPFLVPVRRSLKAEITAARLFITEAASRKDGFIRYGLAPTFISEFEQLVDTLQQAKDVRLSSRTMRRQAQVDFETTLKTGLDVIRDLDAAVEVATSQDPGRFAAWRAARRIEGQRTSAAATATTTVPATTEATTPAPVLILDKAS